MFQTILTLSFRRTLRLCAFVGAVMLFTFALKGNNELVSAQALQPTRAAQGYPSALVAPCAPPHGTVINAMETLDGWYIGTGKGALSASLAAVAGAKGNGIQLNYDLGSDKDAWAQVKRDFDPPLDLSAFDHLRFYYQGTTRNSLEVGFVSTTGQQSLETWHKTTHVGWWTYGTWDFKKFNFPAFDRIKTIFISVTNKDDADLGGSGTLRVDELQALTITARSIPANFETITPDADALQRAAAWTAQQQQPGGLLASWPEEAQQDPNKDYAWLYDQALALIVLSRTDLPNARKLAAVLHTLQNDDGSWYEGYHYKDSAPLNTNKWIGSIAWTVYALTRYYLKSGDPVARQNALEGAQWLASQQQPNGSLGVGTEPHLDTWWAFHTTGYQGQADKLRDYLLNEVWDSAMGRFKAEANNHEIFLDNQTWGASFLRAVGHDADALRALSYAQWTLSTNSSDGTLCGFDGAGPFSVWNEGTLQYVAAGGENSQAFWNYAASQQDANGGLLNSPDNFGGYIVWLSKWRGIAPTAWFYFAGTGEPFHTTCATRPNKPALVAPTNGAVLQRRRVRLDWNSTNCEAFYKLAVKQDAKNGTVVVEKTQAATKYKTKALARGHIYFWRVSACNFTGCTKSAWRQFTIEP